MGFFNSQHHWYATWTGRFTSTALLSVNPLVYNSLAGYKLVLAILVVSQLASIYFLTAALTYKTLSWQEKLIFALTLLFAFLDQMDDVRAGLYWMAGVVTYQVAVTLLFFYFALILLINRDQNFDKFFTRCTAVVIALILGGTNEVVSVLVMLITLLITCYNYQKNKTVTPFQIATFIAVATGCGIGILAPGNFARLKVYNEQQHLLATAGKALSQSVMSIEVWITYPLTLILTCLVLWAIHRKPQLKMLFENFKIINAACILLFLTFVCFFIPYWSTGMPPQNRVVNMIYLLFMIGWMINLAIIFARFGEPILNFLEIIPKKTAIIILAAYMVTLFSLGTSNFVLVTKDLISGESVRYNAEMQQRTAQIINSDNDSCTLENIKSAPRSLFFYFISHDKDDWVNRGYAAYFGKKSVVLIKDGTDRALPDN